METSFMDQILPLFDNKKCFCFSSNTMCDFLKAFQNSDTSAESELLFTSCLRQTAEMYTKEALLDHSVCEGIVGFIQMFHDSDVWCNMVDYLKKKPDKYVVFAFAKSLAAVMYGFPQPLFEVRIGLLIKDMMETARHESDACLLELLIALVSYNNQTCYTSGGCKRTKSCSVSSSEDLFCCLCVILSVHWDSILDRFLRTENPNITVFFALWKLLSEKKLSEDLTSIFFNEKFALEFLSRAFKLPSVALRLYVDITAQIFCSISKSNTWNCSKKKDFEESVATAISGGVLNSLPSCYNSSTFCNSFSSATSVSHQDSSKLDIVSKKVIFIIFSLLAEFQNAVLLSEALDKTFVFIANHCNDWKQGSTHSWIVDTFIDCDDLLFGVMLASLNIYCNLKKGNKQLRSGGCNLQMVGSFKNELDPHRTFIIFLKQIGSDHNELLSFLLSDETCCLLYLLQYLKLFHMEWMSFIESHEILLLQENIQPFPLKSDRKIGGSVSSCTKDCSLSESSFDISNNKKLVSYSSSSSSDEESPNVSDNVRSLNECALATLSVLVNLKDGIQKLIDVQEFPYTILPLMNLLRRAENKLGFLP